MHEILKIFVIFGGIGAIMLTFVAIGYIFIVYVNKKFGLDAYGNQINNRQETHVVKIETIPVYSESEKQLSSQKKQQIDINEDIPKFLTGNVKDLKVESSFNNKRIGKV